MHDFGIDDKSIVIEKQSGKDYNRQAYLGWSIIEISRLNGVHFGREPMKRPEIYEEVKSTWLNGKLSARGAAKLIGIFHTAFNNWVRTEQNYMEMR